jgi:hypothetical protein
MCFKDFLFPRAMYKEIGQSNTNKRLIFFFAETFYFYFRFVSFRFLVISFRSISVSEEYRFIELEIYFPFRFVSFQKIMRFLPFVPFRLVLFLNPDILHIFYLMKISLSPHISSSKLPGDKSSHIWSR